MKFLLANKILLIMIGVTITIAAVLTTVYFTSTKGVFLYEIKEESYVSITGFEGRGSDVTVPDTIEGLPVKEIGFEAFKNNTQITSMHVSANVSSIAGYAFQGASSLKTITFAEDSKLGNIGVFAFNRASSLQSITIPSSVINIGNFAFEETESLEEVIFEDGSGLNKIDFGTFYNATALTSINLPNALTIIDTSAFHNATALRTITIPDSVEVIAGQAFENAIALEEVIISSDSNLRRIGSKAFLGAIALTTFYIPASVQDISEDDLGIGKGAFALTKSMTAFNVSEDNPNYSSLNGVLYNKNQTTLLAYPANNERTSFTIPETVSRLSAFSFSGLKNISIMHIPLTVGYIEEHAFDEALLEEIYLRSTVLSIGVNTFRNCHNLTIFAEPSSLPSGWFYNEQEIPGGTIQITSYNPDNVPVNFNHSFE